MEEDKKKRKNKKKKNKQNKDNESASSIHNHAAEIRSAEAHTDDTSGVDEDPSRHVTDATKIAAFEEKIKQLHKDNEAHQQKEAILEEKLNQLAKEKDASLLKESNLEERIKQLQNENNSQMHNEASFEEKIMQSEKKISSLMRNEASHEEKIRQFQMEKDIYLQKEAEFQMKIFQLQGENNSWLQKEAGFEKRINELVDEVEKLNSKRVSLEEKVKEMEKETENRVQKEAVLEEKIDQLVKEVESLNSLRVSLEEKAKETEKERDNWVQKEKSFRELISSLSRDNALLEGQNTLENGDLNSELVATRAMVDKLVSENAELVEKVHKLYVELDPRGSAPEVSSSLGSSIITRSFEAPHVAVESVLGSDMTLGAVQEPEVDHATEPKSKSNDAVQKSGEWLQPLEGAIEKADKRDHEHVPKIDGSGVVNSSEIESDEIVQIPLDENEVQSADLEAANVDRDEDEEVPLTNAPLIGAPFRLISFVARYVSGADLINKN